MNAFLQEAATPNHALQRTSGFGVQLPGAALIRPAQSRAVRPAMKPGTARAFASRRRAHSRAPGPESLSLGSLGVTMRALLIMFMLAFAGCGSQPTEPAVRNAPDAPEVDVVVSLLTHDYDNSVRRKTPLVVEATFSIAMLRLGDSHAKFAQSLLSRASDDVPADLIRDFCAKNAKPQKVWPELGKRLPVILLSGEEVESLFSAGHEHKTNGWDRFYAKYPKSPGITTISRVGFNRRGDMAMVYVGWQADWLLGHGGIRVLRKQGRKWTEAPAIIGPIWDS